MYWNDVSNKLFLPNAKCGLIFVTNLVYTPAYADFKITNINSMKLSKLGVIINSWTDIPTFYV